MEKNLFRSDKVLDGFWWPCDFNLSFDYCNYRFTEKKNHCIYHECCSTLVLRTESSL